MLPFPSPLASVINSQENMLVLKKEGHLSTQVAAMQLALVLEQAALLLQ
jgi:hypothetical protein